MANRKAAKKTRKTSTRSRAPVTSSVSGSKDFKEMAMEMVSHPAVRYVASGLATAILTRLATNLSERYPEIASFVKENIDHLENGFSAFQDKNSEMSSRARQ